MNAKTLIIAGVAAAVIAGAAVVTTLDTKDTSAAAVSKKDEQPLLPELKKNANNIGKIHIADTATSLTLVDKDGTWVLAEKHDYPVRIDRVREIVMKLADMELYEQKTSNPQLYSRIQVEDVTEPEAQSKLVKLFDKGGKEVGSVILGKVNYGQGARSTNGDQFVRRPGEKQSWLAEGSLNVMVSDRNYLDTDLFDIKGDRLQSITIDHADGEEVRMSRVSKDAPDFTLETIPEGRELSSPNATRTQTGMLQSLRFDDVVPASEANVEGVNPTVVEVETFDGLKLVTELREKDGKDYATFRAEVLDEKIAAANAAAAEEKKDDDASGEEPKAEGDAAAEKPGIDAEAIKKEAETINKKTEGWVYALPAYIADRLQKKNTDFLKELKPEGEEEEADAKGSSLLPPEALADPMDTVANDLPTSPQPEFENQ